MKQSDANFSEKMKKEEVVLHGLGPFEKSDLYMGIVKEPLLQESKADIAKD